MGIGEILSTAFRLYQRHWRTLLTIAAVVVVPITLLHYLLGDLVRTQGESTRDGVVETATWAAGIAWLLAALAGILMYLVLTGAITRAVAAEVAGQDPSVEQSYRFGFHRLGSVLLVSVLVGLATIGGLILFIIPGIYIGIRLCVSIEALVVEGRRGTEAMGRSWGWSAGTGGMPSAPWWWGPAHRHRQRRHHRPVQRHRLVRPGGVAERGHGGHPALQRAGRGAALP